MFEGRQKKKNKSQVLPALQSLSSDLVKTANKGPAFQKVWIIANCVKLILVLLSP